MFVQTELADSVQGRGCTADLEVEHQQQRELQAQRANGGAGRRPEAVQQVRQALRQPGALAAAAAPQILRLRRQKFPCSRLACSTSLQLGGPSV